MATIARSLWLAAKWARFSCNDQALLATCPRHTQSVFNFKWLSLWTSMLWSIDSYQKGIRWPVSHNCIVGSSVRSGVFFLNLFMGRCQMWQCISFHSLATKREKDRLQSKNRTKEDERTSNSKFPFSTGVCRTEIQRNDWRKGLTPDVSFWG